MFAQISSNLPKFNYFELLTALSLPIVVAQPNREHEYITLFCVEVMRVLWQTQSIMKWFTRKKLLYWNIASQFYFLLSFLFQVSGLFFVVVLVRTSPWFESCISLKYGMLGSTNCGDGHNNVPLSFGYKQLEME